jgi:hypothetical protein
MGWCVMVPNLDAIGSSGRLVVINLHVERVEHFDMVSRRLFHLLCSFVLHSSVKNSHSDVTSMGLSKFLRRCRNEVLKIPFNVTPSKL